MSAYGEGMFKSADVPEGRFEGAMVKEGFRIHRVGDGIVVNALLIFNDFNT